MFSYGLFFVFNMFSKLSPNRLKDEKLFLYLKLISTFYILLHHLHSWLLWVSRCDWLDKSGWIISLKNQTEQELTV